MLKFYKPKKTIKEVLKVKSFEYYKYHKGIEGNTAYYVKARLFNRLISIELVCISSDKWCFHVEEKGSMILDSRLGNSYYKNAEKCHSAMVNALCKKFNYENI